MKKNAGCLPIILILFAVGLVLAIINGFIKLIKYVFVKITEFSINFFNEVWNIKIYVLFFILVATAAILLLYRKKLVEHIDNLLYKHKKIASFLLYVSYKTSFRFRKFKKMYLNLTEVFFELQLKTEEDINQNKAFILYWEIKLSNLFRDISNEFQADNMERYIFSPKTMRKTTKEIIKLMSTKCGGNLSFNTLKERDKYIDILEHLKQNFFICILYKYILKLDGKKRDKYLKRLRDILTFSKNLEAEGNISFSISTSDYNVEHFVTSTSIQNGIEYKYYFDVSFNNDILRQRFIVKNENILDNLESARHLEKMQSRTYIFCTSDDAIMKSFEVIDQIQSFVDSEINIVRDIIETNIAKEIKYQM